VIEGPRLIDRHSVIAQGHYAGTVGTNKPTETFKAVHAGRQPKLLMDIHSVSEVNQPNITLSQLDRPAHSTDFKQNKD
jgi:NADH-quinone oxidoreductase subunit G